MASESSSTSSRGSSGNRSRRRRTIERNYWTVSGGKLERLASAAFEGVIRVDDSGRIRNVNEAACVILDTSFPPPPGELIGQTVLEATHVRALSDLCEQAKSEDEAVREITVRSVWPQDRTLRARAIGLPKNGGALLLLLDETEMLRLQTVRTEFVANVSHELRTPLASMRAMAETLLSSAITDTEAAPRFLETIIRESDRLVRLSDALLDLSRAEAVDLEFSFFDVCELVEEVVSRLRYKAEREGVTLDVEFSETIEINADSSAIDQVFFNLIDNAIKYTPTGGQVTVNCQTATTEDGARVAEISVRDSGIGILSQDLPRIFERFWRSDRARKFHDPEKGRASSGTGLGLSIVKHIVESHGGKVTAESELGRGALFTVRLPLNIAQTDSWESNSETPFVSQQSEVGDSDSTIP